jgi:hypothetical protein
VLAITNKERKRDSPVMDVFRDAIAEVGLLRLAAQIIERQDGDRRLVRERDRHLGSTFRRHLGPAPDPHRARDVLERALAAIFKREAALAGQLPLHRIGNADSPRLGHRLEPGGDVHPVSEQIATFDHDITEVDADAEADAALGQDVFLIIRDPSLQGNRTSHGVYDGAKFHKSTVAHQLNDAPLVLCEERIHDLEAQPLDRSEGVRLVCFDQARIPGDVGGHDRREAPLDPTRCHERPPERIWIGWATLILAASTTLNKRNSLSDDRQPSNRLSVPRMTGTGQIRKSPALQQRPVFLA